MKVAHLVIITPRRCGLYETTRELVKGLRELGVDSRMVDPLPDKNPVNFKGTEDRGALVADLEWVKSADILVSHSGLGNLEDLGKPMILCCHGNPKNSIMMENGGSTAIYSHHYTTNSKKNYKAIVTFWPQHVPYLSVMYPDKTVRYVQSSVDLEHWTPGKKQYNFTGLGGGVNIVMADAIRDDHNCFGPLNAYALWARKNKHLNPKLHWFNKPKNMKGWTALVRRIQDDGNMGMVAGWAKGLEHVYRAADVVITDTDIDVRTVREAMACGCPVVRITDIENTGITAALSSDRDFIRKQAEALFNPVNSAKQFKEILDVVNTNE